MQQPESIHPGARGPRGITAEQCGYGRGVAQDVSPASRPGSEVSRGRCALLWFPVAAPLRPAPAEMTSVPPWCHTRAPPKSENHHLQELQHHDSGQTRPGEWKEDDLTKKQSGDNFYPFRKQTAQRLDLLWGIHTHGIRLTSRGREAQGSRVSTGSSPLKARTPGLCEPPWLSPALPGNSP